MKKYLSIFIITVAALLAGGCRFDDSALTERVDDFKNRLEALQGEIDKMNAQLKNLSEIASGNVIQSVLQDSDGNYVITYLDSKDQTRSVVIATASQMINVPVLGVELDEASNIYYWTVTTGSQTTLLLIDGEKVPVSGHTPVVSADAEGYWTVNGQRLTDGSGNPIKAADGQTCIFRSVEKTDDGNLSVVLGSGEVLTLPVQDAFNLTLTAVINTVVIDPSSPVKIGYGLTGAKASEALVGIACAQGIEASIDREAKEVTVTFPSAFTSGVLVMVAYDLASHTVIRPVFFEKALSDRIDIYNAAELLQFASDVNAQNGTELMKAYLMDDIDFATVRASGWTPIGNATYTTANAITGPTFKGIFDGQGHIIRNFNVAVPADAPEGSAWGLFGVLENAEVKNVNFASSCSFSSEAVAMSALGAVAGYVYASTVSNCSSAAVFSFTGGSENLRTSIGGVVGAMCCTDAEDAIVEGCSFSGSMTSTNTSNTKNGGTGISIGGIAGFSDALGTPSSGMCLIRDCVNNGTLDVQATRTAGIIATMNKFSKAENCTNNGPVTCSDTKALNSRVAGIVSGMGTATHIASCVNNADITFSVTDDKTHGYAAGIVGQTNADGTTIDRCENYGTIRSDMYKADLVYMGIIVGNFNTKKVTVSNCKLGGAIGPYSGDPLALTEDNCLDNLTLATSKAANATLADNVFAGGPAPAPVSGIASAADLLEFADSVNAGNTYKKFQDETGTVNLLDDIDCSSLESWKPIGYATVKVSSKVASVTEGHAFDGCFNGNGHVIKGLKMTAPAGNAAGQAYGFFGTLLQGAKVYNFQFDEASSLTIESTAFNYTGVIAGLVQGAEVRDITSYAPVTFKGQTKASGSSTTSVYVGLVGYMLPGTSGTEMDSCHNRGLITALNLDGITSAGGTAAYTIAGVVGFADGTAEVLNTISDCSNYGDLISATARTAGIIGAANGGTQIIGCVNYGNQTNTVPADRAGRLGGITCLMGSACTMSGCINYGNIVSTTSARIGGLVSLFNSTSALDNCANYGEIITDNSGDSIKARGLFWGYNNQTVTLTKCTAGGRTGLYNNGTYIYDEYTEASKVSYLGPASKTVDDSDVTYQVGFKPEAGIDYPEADLRILFIGNSFTKDAVEHLPGILDAAATGKKIQLTHMYYGGRTILEYYEGWESKSDYKCYQCAPGESSWTESTEAYTLRQIASATRWDIVTIQEHTGNKAAWIWDDTEKNAITGLVNYIKETQETAPKFWYVMSQAYFNMSKIASASQPYITWTDQAGMYGVIVAQGKKVMEETPMDGILATGTYLQNLRSSSLDNEMNLTRDGYHMDYGISRYGAACLMFESLITPFTGVTMDGNSYRYTTSSTVSGSYSTPVTSANIPFALTAARYAIEKPYEVTDMSEYGVEKPDNGVTDIEYEEGNKE